MKYQVTPHVHWLNPDTNPPPKDTKIFVLTKYGIANIGYFQPEFHVGWFPLLKIPQEIKEKIGAVKNG